MFVFIAACHYKLLMQTVVLDTKDNDLLQRQSVDILSLVSLIDHLRDIMMTEDLDNLTCKMVTIHSNVSLIKN